jgi:glycine/sarcosine N-methyltransferase
VTTARFYDDLANYYDLIFQDWESSMSRQGEAIGQLIRRELGAEYQPPEISIVDASAGIGTQAFPLARKGYRVTARDISPDAQLASAPPHRRRPARRVSRVSVRAAAGRHPALFRAGL